MYVWPDGKTYSGEWEKNKMDGHGLLKWADGKEYEGKFVSDKR